jgi:regulator of protease activity HflC (stomatin/prohibitin superfamily)
LIDSSFRNEAGKKDALSFISDRVELQKGAHDKAVEVFKPHHVMVQNLLVGYIAAPAELLATQSLKQIATQQKAQFAEQAVAAEALIEVREKEARANKQTDVVNAELTVVINENNAKAAVKTAEGQRDSKRIVADGEAYSAREIGKGVADAYTAQKDAIGEGAIAGIKLAEIIGDKHIKVVPDIFVGNGDGLSAIAGSMFGSLLNKKILGEANPPKK